MIDAQFLTITPSNPGSPPSTQLPPPPQSHPHKSSLPKTNSTSHSPQPQGLTVNGLSALMALHQTTTSNLVNALTERKLIRRVRDDADQRIVHLHASAQGKQLLLLTPGPHAGLLVDALRRLDSSQLGQLSDSLKLVVTVMRRTAETAAGETLMGE